MRELRAALWTEGLKALRTPMLWITTAVFAFIMVMMGVLIFVAKHPDVVHAESLLSAKASIFARTDWPGFFAFLEQIAVALGMIGFGFVLSWVFGREFADRTVKDLLALPVSRGMIVTAKFLVAAVWCAALALVLFTAGVVAGLAVHLSGWSLPVLAHTFMIYAGTAFLTLVASTPVAFIAGYGRGYLLPLGYLILVMIITQFTVNGISGIAPYFPWAIPALFCGAAGPDLRAGIVSYAILLATGMLGCLATALWWRRADHT